MKRTGAWVALFVLALLAAAAWIRSNAQPDDLLLHVEEIARTEPALLCANPLVAEPPDREREPPARAALATVRREPPRGLTPMDPDDLRQEIRRARRDGRLGEVELLSFRYRLETFRRKAGRDRASEAQLVLAESIREILLAQGRMLPPNTPSVHATEQAWDEGWRYLSGGGRGAFAFHVDEFPAYEVLRVANLEAAENGLGPDRDAHRVPESTYDEIEERALTAYALLEQRVFQGR